LEIGSLFVQLGLDMSAFQRGLQDAQNQLNSVSDKMKGIGQTMSLAITAPISAAGAVILKGAMDAEAATGKLQAQLGITADEANDLGVVAKEVWKSGFGDSIEEATESIKTVRQNMGILAEDELQKVAQGAMTIADVFEQDVSAVTASAGVVMKNFGIEGQDALDILTVGFQKGGDFSGELLDTMREYAPQFAAMGFTADQAMATLIAGAEQGAFNLDKIGDAAKESFLRLKDGSKTSTEAFTTLGLDANKMAADIAGGGEKANAAFQATLLAISALEDPVARDRASIALFGTTVEDLGQGVVLAMSEGAKGLDNFQGATEDAAKAVYGNNPGLSLTIAMREMQAAIAPALLPLSDIITNTIVPAIKTMVDGFNALSPVGQKTAIVIAGIAAAIGPMLIAASMVSDSISSIIKIAPQLGRAFAVATGPIGLTVIAIAALVAGGIALYKNWDTIKAKGVELYNSIKATFDGIKSNISKLWSEAITWGSNIVQGIINGITSKLQSAKDAALAVAKSVKDAITGFFNIQSPSKVTEELGKYITEGLAKGIQENISDAEKAAQNLAQAVQSAVSTILSDLDKTFNLQTAQLELNTMALSDNVTEIQRLENELQKLQLQQEQSAQRVSVLNDIYETAKQKLGENDEAIKQYKYNLEIAKIAHEKLNKEIENNKFKQEAAAIKESEEALKKNIEALDEITKTAQSNYDAVVTSAKEAATEQEQAAKDIYDAAKESYDGIMEKAKETYEQTISEASEARDEQLAIYQDQLDELDDAEDERSREKTRQSYIDKINSAKTAKEKAEAEADMAEWQRKEEIRIKKQGITEKMSAVKNEYSEKERLAKSERDQTETNAKNELRKAEQKYNESLKLVKQHYDDALAAAKTHFKSLGYEIDTVTSKLESMRKKAIEANNAVSDSGSSGSSSSTPSSGTTTNPPIGPPAPTNYTWYQGNYGYWNSDGKFIVIPTYASGTGGHPGGAAIIDEEGNEIIDPPDGDPFIFKESGPKLLSLKSGTQVIPHEYTKKLLDMGIPGYADGTYQAYTDSNGVDQRQLALDAGAAYFYHTDNYYHWTDSGSRRSGISNKKPSQAEIDEHYAGKPWPPVAIELQNAETPGTGTSTDVTYDTLKADVEAAVGKVYFDNELPRKELEGVADTFTSDTPDTERLQNTKDQLILDQEEFQAVVTENLKAHDKAVKAGLPASVIDYFYKQYKLADVDLKTVTTKIANIDKEMGNETTGEEGGSPGTTSPTENYPSGGGSSSVSSSIPETDTESEEDKKLNSVMNPYNSAMTDFNNKSAEFRAELAAENSALGENATETDRARLAIKEANTERDLAKEKVDILKTAYESSLQTLGENNEQTKQFASDLKIANSELVVTENNVTKAGEAYKNAAKASGINQIQNSFTASMQKAADTAELAREQLKLEETALGDNATETEKYQLKLKGLAIDKQEATAKAVALAIAYEDSRVALGENATETLAYKRDLDLANISVKQINASIENTTTAMNEYKKSTAEAIKDKTTREAEEKEAATIEEIAEARASSVKEIGDAYTSSMQLSADASELARENLDLETIALGDNATETEKYQLKLKGLNIDKQEAKAKVTALTTAYEDSKLRLGDNATETLEYKKKLDLANISVEKIDASITSTTKSMDGYAVSVAKAATATAFDAAVKNIDEIAGHIQTALKNMYDQQEQAELDALDNGTSIFAQETAARLAEIDTQETALLTSLDQQTAAKLAALNDQEQATLSSLDMQVQAEKDTSAGKIATLKASTDAAIKIRQDEIDFLTETVEQEDEAEKQRLFNSKISKLEQQKLLTTSEFEKSLIQAKIDIEKQNWQKEQDEKARKVRIEQLSSEINDIKDSASEQEQVEEDRLDIFLNSKEDERKTISQHYETLRKDQNIYFESERNRIQDEYSQLREDQELALANERTRIQGHYDQLRSSEAMEAETRRLLLLQNNDELITLLGTYNPQWYNSGKTLGERLAAGIQDSVALVKAAVATMNAAIIGITNPVSIATSIAGSLYGQGITGYKETAPGYYEVTYVSGKKAAIGKSAFDKDFIPQAAEGAITTDEGLVYIHPQEAIMPLSKLPSMMTSALLGAIQRLMPTTNTISMSGASGQVINNYTIHATIPARDIAEMKSVSDFFARLPQAARARG